MEIKFFKVGLLLKFALKIIAIIQHLMDDLKYEI